MNCPGSVKASRGVVQTVNDYMREGTAAHEILERAINANEIAPLFIEFIHVEGKDIPVTDEMIEAVKVALDWYDEENADATAAHSEVLLDMSEIDPRMGGTADIVIAKPARLVMADYKHGVGYTVAVENNAQLRFYAVGVWLNRHKLGADKITDIELVIIQPRGRDGQPIKRHVISLMELVDFEQDLRDAVKRIDKDPDKRVAGSWCKWCPVEATCPAALQMVRNVTNVEILPYKTAEGPDLIALKIALDQSGYVEDWLHAVWAYAEQLAFNGSPVTGYKVVAGKKSRSWKDDGDEEGTAECLRDLGVPDEKVWTHVLISPAQAERLVPAHKEDIGKLIKETPGKPTLVPESDKRPALDTALHFDPLDDKL